MRSFVLVIFAIIKFVQAEYGWTPITSEEIFRRWNVNTPKPLNIQQLDPSSYQNIDLTTENYDEIKYDAIKLVEPQKLYGLAVKRFGLPAETNITKSDTKKQETNYTKIETITVNSLRKAKKIDDRKYVDTSDNNLIQEQIPDATEEFGDNLESFTEQKPTVENETKAYEITESLETTDSEPTFEVKSGYVYSPPEKKPSKVQINFTDKLRDILSKYNIDSKDKLNNYAKSRIPSQRVRHPQIMYLPIPVRYPQRYNSLNHIAVDPLIAVFLSNYGHYLPYSYGIHNNYRNLYGYLASNNIHNNKPFGPYKIFSDTDSSV